MNRSEEIIEFIVDELLEDDEEEITLQTSLFKCQILDSLNLLSLIAFLEKKYNIRIAASEVNYENLDTVENMELFIGRKLLVAKDPSSE